MPPVYIDFRAEYFSPQLSFADLESASMSLVHLAVIQLICSLKVSLQCNTMPKYFKLCTCVSGLLFRYTSNPFVSVSTSLFFIFRR